MIRFLAVIILVTATHAAAQLPPDELAKVDEWLAQDTDARPSAESLGLTTPIAGDELAKVKQQLWERVVAAHPAGESPLGPLPELLGKLDRNNPPKIRGGMLKVGDDQMPFAVLRRESEPAKEGERSLFLCLHGGGQNAKAEGPHAWDVNTREFQSQVGLAAQVYPADGIYWIPRMADDRKGRWWHAHNQQAFDEVIDHAVMHWGVDPNRVYLLGISEGGYGTDILGPFMADRWAGAAAMAAGVGLENPPANLRNVAFRTDVGELDNMFKRQEMAVAFHARLDKLHEADSEGYTHSINLQKGRGHGIEYSAGPKWIAEHTRNPLPERVVWIDRPLDKLRRDQFYWVEQPDAIREGTSYIAAEVDRTANRVTITAKQLAAANKSDELNEAPALAGKLALWLTDDLVDFERPCEVVVNDGTPQVFELKPTVGTLLESLTSRFDPSMAAPCRLEIELP